MNVIAVGENIIDYYCETNEVYIGGNCINFIMNLKKISNFKLSYVGPIANDKEGNEIQTLLHTQCIDIHKASYLEGETARSYIKIVNGERVFTNFRSGVLDGFILEEHQKAFIKEQDHIHSSIMGGTLPFLKELKGQGTLSFDFSKLNNINILKAAAPLVDYVFLSRDRLGDEEQNLMKELYLAGSKQVILLLGEKGSAVYDGYRFYEKCSILQEDIIDSLGAGDAYIAGYMERILNGYDVEVAMEQGNILAAELCTNRGGFFQ